MRDEYDFSGAKRKALVPVIGKTRITIYLDNAVLEEFRSRAEAAGAGYQTLINDALKLHLSAEDRPLTEKRLRAILEEVLPAEDAGLTGRSRRTRAKARAS